MEDTVDAMTKEMKQRAGEFSGSTFETLYFGGGTPSVLQMHELDQLLETAHQFYHFSDDYEFTLEVNPDDLSPGYLRKLKARGVNRLSIGIQSFRDADLRLMRRSHPAATARMALSNALEAGFFTISADLIYGVPGMTTKDFVDNLEELFRFGIPHISAYHLTYEPGTVFDHWRKKGRLIPAPEEESLSQYAALRERTMANEYIHYEISNFARKGFFSRHNMNYWKQVPYIGIGPSAHSYTGTVRRWNVSSLKAYIAAVGANDSNLFDNEVLSVEDLYNEYVLTSLRTMWGLDLQEIKRRFGDHYVKYTLDVAGKYIGSGELEKTDSTIRLSEKGFLLADYLVREFFRTT